MEITTGISPEVLMHTMAKAMGMIPAEAGVRGCGSRYVGDGIVTEGYFWFYAHEDYFVLTECNFVFLRECLLSMPLSLLYLVLRLEYANHLPPGKIISFMEETGNPISSPMKKGMRVAYTELMYFPVFYRKHLDACFTSLSEDPVEILRHMGGEHNWSSDMVRILCDIKSCAFVGATAELFYVGRPTS